MVAFLGHRGIIDETVAAVALFLCVTVSVVTTTLGFRGLATGVDSIWKNHDDDDDDESAASRLENNVPKEGSTAIAAAAAADGGSKL